MDAVVDSIEDCVDRPVTPQLVPHHNWSPTTTGPPGPSAANYVAIDGPPGPSMAAMNGPPCHKWSPDGFEIASRTGGKIAGGNTDR